MQGLDSYARLKVDKCTIPLVTIACTYMKYAWDEAKRLKNLTQHQLDFRAAWQVYEHPDKVTENDPYPSEERFRALAEVDGVVRFLVYTGV